MMIWFRQGRKDYLFGSGPLWQVFRALYQMTKNPYVIGGSLLLLGFVMANIRRDKRAVSKELMDFIRKEQGQRLKKSLSLRG